MKLYWNPFRTYSIACSFVVLVYSLRFSDLYLPFSADLLFFLSATILLSICLSRYFSSLRGCFDKQLPRGRHDLAIFLMLVMGFICEIAYSGGAPFYWIISGQLFDYREFGIPTFHVLLVGVNFFFAIYWWDVFLLSRKKSYFYMSILSMAWAIIIVSRGAFLISLIAFLFAYGNRIGLRRRLIALVLFAASSLWAFGYVGELRTSAMGIIEENVILRIGGANKNFADSGLPNNFFWTYLYSSSPLANLQITINNYRGQHNYLPGLALDYLPDFLSKHMVAETDMANLSPLLATPELNVSTAFARPYIAMGWIGPITFFIYYALFCCMVMLLARKSRYFPALLALLAAQGSLMFFDNMLVFSGIIGPLLVGLTLVCFERISINKKQIKRLGSQPV